MAKRPTIGDNPLDSMIPEKKNGITAVMDNAPEPIRRASQKKERITVQISVDVIERVKNAVYWTPGLTLASLAEEALATAVDKLEKTNKEPFRKRREELKSGRPIG